MTGRNFLAVDGFQRCFKKMKNISLVTLGCKVNQYDTAAIINNLPSGKYRRNSNFTDHADVYIIDTCTVTHKADSEARNYINKAKRSNPDGVVIVTGCYAQVSSDELAELSGVDYVVGNSHKFKALLKLIKTGEPQDYPHVYISNIFREKKRLFSTPDINYFPDRTRAFLKVQDGCNYACTFCIIPKARGRSRSLESGEIINRIVTLRNNGYKEVVLTGIHLASYGRDIGTDLLELLKEIERKKVINRIRLSSLDPADMSDDLIDFAAESEVVCPSFHISLQSGDKDILRRMRRRYKPDDFMRCTDRIRSSMPEASIGTDIMVGFPGETEKQFNNTYKITSESALTYFHVFPYSIRKNTVAANMEDQIHSSTKKTRSKIMRELGNKKKSDFYKTFVGQQMNAIVESNSRGTTYNYIDIKFTSQTDRVGEEVPVRILGVEGQKAIASIP